MEGIGIGAGGVGVGLTVEDGDAKGRKVIFCIPTITRPHEKTLDALEASYPLIEEAGWQQGIVFEIGCPYISAARMKLLRKALDAKADVIVFIDHDVSWEPRDLLTLIDTKGDVVAGTYRFKKDEEEYMGLLDSDLETHKPRGREDGCIRADLIPAGFLKVTKEAIDKFMKAYPELCFGPAYASTVDLFHHGADDGRWYSEDYAFAKRWRAMGNDIWLIPTLHIDHWTGDICFKGFFHDFLLRQPGGKKWQGDKNPGPLPQRRRVKALSELVDV